MTPNPILIREVRARWRGWGAFTLMFLYAAGLSVMMAWRYWEMDANEADVTRMPGQHLAALGHDMFLTASLAQGGMWMLISAALCAPAIAGERERGLLDSLQLSQLTAGHIVLGKLEATLSFVFLLMLVPLPITAVCFFLGGVSTQEFVVVFLLHIVAAVSGAAIGLAVSAWSRRTTSALAGAVAVLAGWAACGIVAFGGGVAIGGTTASSGTDHLLHIAGLAGMVNPVLTVAVLVDPVTHSRFAPGTAGLTLLPLICRTGPLAVSALTALALLVARRGVRRTFSSHQSFVERKRHLTLQGSLHSKRLMLQLAERQSANHQAPLWWNTPLLSYVRFRNPVLQREVHSRFRLRRAATLATLLKVAGLLTLVYYYCQFWWQILTVVYRREAVWWQLAEWCLFGSIVGATLMGARTFSRERESGAWDSIKLSLLPAREIVAGKMTALLLACLAYSLPLWPLCWCCIREVAPFVKVGVPVEMAAISILIVAATAWLCAAWAMLASVSCSRTVGALSAVLVSFLAILGILAVVIPAAQALFWWYWTSGATPSLSCGSSCPDLAPYWNPIVALGQLRFYSLWGFSGRYGYYIGQGDTPDLSGPLGCASLLFTVGTLLLLLTWRRLAVAMRPEAR